MKNLKERIKLSDGNYELISEKELSNGRILMYKNIKSHAHEGDSSEMKKTETIENTKSAKTRMGSPIVTLAPANLIFGFDTEYVTSEGWSGFNNYTGLFKIDGFREIVSYQFFTEIEDNRYGFIIYPWKDTRISMRNLFNMVIASLNDFYQIPGDLKVLLISHFGLTDISATDEAKTSILSKSSIHDKCVFTTKPIKLRCYTPTRTLKNIKLVIRDSMLLAAGHPSLKVLGEALGYEKIFAGENIFDTMKWKETNHSEFVGYAINDALICYEWITTIYKEELKEGLEKVPVTIGNEAAKFAHEKIKEINGWNNEEFDLYFRGIKWFRDDDGKGKYVRNKKALPSCSLIHTLARDSYYGGRNECYTSGIFKEQTYDYDLKGAYVAGLALLEDPDFSKRCVNMSGTLNLRSIDPLSYGFGYIGFKFPEGTKMPCLPVKTERGLIFPMEGETYACNPEVYAALLMGAKIWVEESYKIANSFRDKKSFAEVARIGTMEREAQKKGSAIELSKKERNNCWYGKLGQGLKEVKSYDPFYRKMIEVGDSLITNEVLVAHLTSLVRALISLTMAEVINKGYTIHSVTTDGFISDIPYEELLEINAGTLTDAFKGARKYLSGKEKIWEIKHSQKTLINIKTRANIGLNDDSSKLGVFAAGSCSLPREVKIDFEESQREYLAELFLNRSDENPVISQFVRFPSVRQLMENTERDFIGELAEAKTNFEFDYKRKPINVRDEEVTINGKTYNHVTFETEPWKNEEEFNQFRIGVENRKRTVKTSKELKDLRFQVQCAKYGVINAVSVERTKATQILRNVRAGNISTNYSGEEIIEKINNYFNLDLGIKAWNDAGRKDRQTNLIDTSLLMKDLVAMKLI